jgi:hypothetical protein
MFASALTKFRRGVLSSVGVFCLVGGLSACTTAPPAPEFQDPRFVDGGAIPVRAAHIDVTSTYQPTFAPPNVEHLFPISPERVARQWVLDRLQPLRAGDVVGTFTITDARVTETKLAPKVTGVKGAFTNEPSERYDAFLTATLVFSDPANGQSSEVETSAKYSMTVQEDASLNERERVWYQLVVKLGETFDKAMVANMQKYVPEYVDGQYTQ